MVKLNKKKWGKEFWDWYDNLVKLFFIAFMVIFLLIGMAIVITSAVEDGKAEEIISYLFLGIMYTIIIIVVIWLIGKYIKAEIELWRSNKLNKEKKKEWFLSDDEKRLKSADELEKLIQILPDSPNKEALLKHADIIRNGVRKREVQCKIQHLIIMSKIRESMFNYVR